MTAEERTCFENDVEESARQYIASIPGELRQRYRSLHQQYAQRLAGVAAEVEEFKTLYEETNVPFAIDCATRRTLHYGKDSEPALGLTAWHDARLSALRDDITALCSDFYDHHVVVHLIAGEELVLTDVVFVSLHGSHDIFRGHRFAIR